METVLESLGESGPLSPLSTNVHDEDFTTLGDHTAGVMEEPNLHSDGDEALGAQQGDDDDDDSAMIVPASIADDDDPISLAVAGTHHTEELQHHVGLAEPVKSENAEHGEALEEDGAPATLDTGNHLVQAAEQEGILLTTDADGNLSVPVSADHVIQLLMQTSDGNVVAANASVGAIKLSMSDLISSTEGGNITRTVQAVTLPDGTTTLIETPKEEMPGQEEQVMAKFVDGQTIKLEDGSTALLQTTSTEALPEGLQAIQLEDGSTAFISHSHPETLFQNSSTIDTRNLQLDQLANQTLLENAEKPAAESKPILIGDRAFKCMYEDCGRLYTTPHHLKVHERSHTGDRPFECEYPNCGKRFATSYGLKSHNRVHTGEKPYPCPHTDKGCEKAFKTSGDLQKHVRTHTGERPFKCPFEGCTQSFTTSNIRKVHIRTHTGERPYICNEDGCKRAFASATNYKNHMRIHSGEKPYVCTVLGCGKRFTEYSSLYKHHVVHTHTKPYTCHCGKTYRQTSTLAMHKRTAHGEETPILVSASGENGEHGILQLEIPNRLSEPQEPPVKKQRASKSSSSQEGEETSHNLINTAEASHMVLLTSGVSTSGGTTTLLSADNTQQVASLVALQASAPLTLQDLQQSGLSGLTSLSLGENGQQVLVVTDPAQLEALQQLAAHHLENLAAPPEAMAAHLQTIAAVEGDHSRITTLAETSEGNVISQ